MTEISDLDFRLNHRIRKIVGICFLVAIGAMHGFRIGQLLNGNMRNQRQARKRHYLNKLYL